MLSLSADLSQAPVNLDMVIGDEAAAEGVAHGRALLSFAEAIARRDESALVSSRQALEREAGAGVVVDAAAVAANFQRMVRIADSTGIPLDTAAAALSAGIRKQLDLGSYGSAQDTPKDGWKVRLLSLVARPIARRKLGRRA